MKLFRGKQVTAENNASFVTHKLLILLIALYTQKKEHSSKYISNTLTVQ